MKILLIKKYGQLHYIYDFLKKMKISGEEKQESNSITSQKTLLKEFVNEHDNLIIYNTYVDDGYTGTDFNRPSFKKLLEDMKNRKY